METESIKKTEQWANDSRTQGLWSVGLLIFLFFTSLFSNNAGYGSGAEFILSCLVFLLVFANIVSSTATSIFAFIALWRNSREGNDATIKRTATIGLVLGMIPVVILSSLFCISVVTSIW